MEQRASKWNQELLSVVETEVWVEMVEEEAGKMDRY